MFEPHLLRGKRILVTGGGSGLGREIAERYLQLGAEVHICGRRQAMLDATVAELEARHGGMVRAHAVDIRHADSVDAMIERIWAGYGPLDGLVNNAAGNFVSRTQDVSPRGFDAVANTVLHGTYYVTHHVGRRWIAGGHKGSVISIVVTWVRTGAPFVVPSAMSKAGIDVMTKSLARALAPRVRVLGVAPGVVDTGFVPGRGADFNEKTSATTPLRRVATADDVAAAILSCATHLGFSTGTTITVDGGRSL